MHFSTNSHVEIGKYARNRNKKADGERQTYVVLERSALLYGMCEWLFIEKLFSVADALDGFKNNPSCGEEFESWGRAEREDGEERKKDERNNFTER